MQPPVILKGWEEIAQYLNMHKATAKRLRKNGLPVIRVDRKVYSTGAAIESWILENLPEATKKKLPVWARGCEDVPVIREDNCAALRQELAASGILKDNEDGQKELEGIGQSAQCDRKTKYS